MAATGVRAGLRRLTIDGEVLDITAEGINYSFGGIQLTEIMGAEKYHGLKGTPLPAFVQFSTTDHAVLEVEGLLDRQGVTIVFTLLNGKTLVLNNATNTSDRTAETTDGKIALRFVGDSLTELKE